MKPEQIQKINDLYAKMDQLQAENETLRAEKDTRVLSKLNQLHVEVESIKKLLSAKSKK